MFIISDNYIEDHDTVCTPWSNTKLLAISGTTLDEAKKLCSMDVTCFRFIMSEWSDDKGTSYKCLAGSDIDNSDKYILYTKGIVNILTDSISAEQIYLNRKQAYPFFVSVSNESFSSNVSFDATSERPVQIGFVQNESLEGNETDSIGVKTERM